MPTGSVTSKAWMSKNGNEKPVGDRFRYTARLTLQRRRRGERVTKLELFWLAGLLALCVGASPAPPSSPAQASNAANSIAALHAALLDVMQNAESLGYEGRSEKLTPVIPRYFDVEFMARKAVGRHCNAATD